MKLSQTEKDKNDMISLVKSKKKKTVQVNLFTKQKYSEGQRKQMYGWLQSRKWQGVRN